MITYLLCAGIALCAFSLWLIARHDWFRLTRPSCRVQGEVIGHQRHSDGDGQSYSARYRFTADGADHEVVDAVYSASAAAPLGSRRMLAYPEGRPDLARPPRPLMWIAVYALLIGLGGVLLAKAAGWMPG